MPEKIANNDADWSLYAGHRERFTRAVASASETATARLCILGAGKCNDLDLARLAERFSELHLVDIDPGSVASAVSRQSPDTRRKLVPHTPVDLSLLSAKRSEKWRRKPPASSELEQLRESHLRALLARLPGPFEVVVSACVLTQLGFALTQSFREPQPLLGALRMNVLQLHLQTLLGLTSMTGTALLVTDLASSTHYPLDQLAPGVDLGPVMQDIVAKRAFYQLARPDLIEAILSELEPEHAPVPLAPWRWNGPQARTYLVYGFSISRA
jgi:hypothetical protein